VANGEVNPREDEDTVDGGTILGEIGDADAEQMAALIAKMKRGRDAINSIRTTCISEGGFDTAPVLEKLPEAFEEIIAMISQGTGADVGGDAAEGEGAEGEAVGIAAAAGAYVQLPTGDVKTREDAIEALFQAERYYALHEPSSPLVLLLREARSAASKTFAELVSELLPSSASSAFFAFGKEPWFEVPLNDISYRNPAPDYETDASASSGDESWEDAGLDEGPTDNDEPAAGNDAPDATEAGEEAASDDGWSSSSYGESAGEEEAPADDGWTSSNYGETAEPEEASADDGESSSSEDSSTEGLGSSDAGKEQASDDGHGAGRSAAAGKFVANTRPEALSLIEKVLAYYRVAEPSSPVALMLERAIELSSKNFIGLLREVLPDGHLKIKAPPKSESSSGGW
jgi:hypothetical protein